MCRTHSEEGKTTLVTFRFLSRQKTWECMSQRWTRAGRVELAICFCLPTCSAPVPLGNLPSPRATLYKPQDQLTLHSILLVCVLLVALIEP